MFLFLKLVLAHLIADFVLQFDELYKLKVRSKAGHVLHVLIHFLTSMLLVIPYLSYLSMWIFLVFLTAVHYLQDIVKYSVQKKEKKMFVAFVTDQIIHIGVLAGVLVLPIGRLELGFPSYPNLDFYYLNHALTIFMIFFFLITFAGSYLQFAFRRSYFPRTSRPNHGITSFEISYAILERTLVGGIFLFAVHPYWMIAAPFVGCLRFPFKVLRDKTDYILSFTYALFLGLLFRLWL